MLESSKSPLPRPQSPFGSCYVITFNSLRGAARITFVKKRNKINRIKGRGPFVLSKIEAFA